MLMNNAGESISMLEAYNYSNYTMPLNLWKSKQRATNSDSVFQPSTVLLRWG